MKDFYFPGYPGCPGQPGSSSFTGVAQIRRAHTSHNGGKKEAPTDQHKRNDLSDETGEVLEGTAKPDYQGRMRSATTFRVAGLRMHSETNCSAAGQQCRESRANESDSTRTTVQPLQDCSSQVSDYQMSALQHTIQSRHVSQKQHGSILSECLG